MKPVILLGWILTFRGHWKSFGLSSVFSCSMFTQICWWRRDHISVFKWLSVEPIVNKYCWVVIVKSRRRALFKAPPPSLEMLFSQQVAQLPLWSVFAFSRMQHKAWSHQKTKFLCFNSLVNLELLKCYWMVKMFIIKIVKCAFCHFLFPSVIYWYDSGLHFLTHWVWLGLFGLVVYSSYIV